MIWWLLTQGTRMFLLVQTLRDCFKDSRFIDELDFLVNTETLICTNSSTPLWINGGNGNQPLNLWQETCRTLQVTLKRTLTSLDYRILTEALSGQEKMLWVCLGCTQVPRGDIFFCFYLSFWFSSAFTRPWFVFSIRMWAETWICFSSHRERESLSQDI